MVPKEEPSIQFLIVANRVWIADDLLNVSGGGWGILNRVIPPGNSPLPGDPPPTSPFGIAVIVTTRWHQTRRGYKLIVEICDEDGTLIGNIHAHVVQIEPPSKIRPGSMQYRPFTMQMEFPFPHAGGYEVIARIEGVESSERRWPFEVRDIQQK